MSNKHKRMKTLVTASNCVELGTGIIKSLSGDTLNGNKMEALTNVFAVHLSNELKKKGNVSC